ncbi:carbamoyltransferase [Amycolatopsis rubida]|uniref:Carbamoyltransferase n=1 Tax=Amycolatopsis rubida TaxID=112413 RepID=A0ABX0BR30_9PSEU|nr:carbamoyltransferase N-terminal domain-containing protein [Amycolatopsis sp. M39]MYW93115.1 carbamoyltransferase [Amycolatopsis rubida]NEC58102.1 carbamoyltransferase [Amycolatopsis rubida]OAP22856.1 Decarbamoylnovobiocin carbamoyltransferase [Amycolatopsis sp. M39]
MSRSDVVCGLKLTHDGAVAVIGGTRLVASVEAEKIGNRPRHSALDDAAEIVRELARNGFGPDAIDRVAVDGWAAEQDGPPAVGFTALDGRRIALPVAGYADEPGPPAPPAAFSGTRPVLGERGPRGYAGYTHATGHLLSGYCTSPFAKEGRAALGIVWDGGMPPFLYLVDPREPAITPIGALTGVSGALYPVFASHFAPFRVDRRTADPDRRFGMEALFPVSGKAMAYASLGKPIEAAVDRFEEVTAATAPATTPMRCYQWSARALRRVRPLGLSDAELLASFQEALYRGLERGLREVFAARPELAGLPLCVSGGCGLNIKWNARLRGSGLFPDVWVPPFPNDAGSAIGAACAEMARTTGKFALEWTEFAGPPVRWDGAVPEGWSAQPCDVTGLAALLARTGEPVVVVTGRAELGPRALGRRSIIAPATDPAMRDRLNEIKGRESYRPVAPICLEHRAPEVFDPGTRDPYMVFDHTIRPGWQDRVPAIVHVDGSARLQTVGPDNQPAHELLSCYERLTGIPVLCNTSANFSGRGFFPDPGSAMSWGGVSSVWSEGTLYRRDGRQ